MIFSYAQNIYPQILLHYFLSPKEEQVHRFILLLYLFASLAFSLLLLPPLLDSSTFPIHSSPQALVSHFLFLLDTSSPFVIFSRLVLLLAPSSICLEEAVRKLEAYRQKFPSLESESKLPFCVYCS
ncbi:hypothetical protein IC582_008284 [Cucumis melo]